MASYSKGIDRSQLTAHELLKLWQGLSEERRLAFLGSLSDEAAEQLLTLQLRRTEAKDRSKRREMQQQKHWPQGNPTDLWSDEELAAYLAHHEADLAVAPSQSADAGEAI